MEEAEGKKNKWEGVTSASRVELPRRVTQEKEKQTERRHGKQQTHKEEEKTTHRTATQRNARMNETRSKK